MKRLVLLFLLCCWIASCSNGSQTPDPGPANANDAVLPVELQNPQTPAGVDAELYGRLVAQLRSVLENPARFAAETADDPASATTLLWVDESSSLQWSHRMKGDYDLNGEVNISDITPIAIHFGESGPFAPGSIQSVVDGDGNGEINIADITPIGINYGRLVTGYNIFTSNNGDEYALPAVQLPAVQFVGMEKSVVSDDGQHDFTVVVSPASNGHFFWVRPTDGTQDGVASNTAGPGEPPLAVLDVVPWIGQPLGADFDASGSSSPRALALTYEFDFTGDGTFDYTGADSMVSSPLAEPGSYVAILQVTDENGSYASTSQQYMIADVGGGAGELGRGGGELQLGDIMVEAVPGSLLGDMEIVAYQTELPPGLPESFFTGSPACHIGISDDDMLNAPLKMTLPYDDAAFGDESNVSVLYFDKAHGWMPTTLLDLDTENNRIKVDSRRFGTFVVGWFDISKIVGFLQSSLPFDPALHGWNINNFGNYFSPGGNCLGMSGYCQWFYTEGPSEILNGKYSSAGGNPVSIAHLTAARGHLAQSQAWAFKSWDGQMASTEGLVGLTMKIYLSVFEDPLVLLLGVNGSGNHACVVYEYDDMGFTFYDVNSKNNEQFLPFDGNTGFGNYGSWNSFGFIAGPSMGRAEDFGYLTTEAENGFALSQDIQLTSPTFGQVVAGNSVQITGNLLSGLNGQAEVIAYVNGMLNTIPVNAGHFSGSVPINNGDNSIIIMAGTMSQSDWKRNGATLVTSVTGTSAIKKVAVYNNWLRNLADLDLYVIEPNGEPVWPGHPRSKKLLNMLLENDSGFGPEMVALQPDNDGQVEAGEYKVRVHYRQDLGTLAPTGPVQGSVLILLNEGMENQELRLVPYYIADDNPDNTAADAMGSDWVDIAMINVMTGEVTNLHPPAGM